MTRRNLHTGFIARFYLRKAMFPTMEIMARTPSGRRSPSIAAITFLLATARLGAQAPPMASADVQDVQYDVTFDRTTSAARTMKVAMTFTVGGGGPVLLSLPEWTPGAYEISNFARWVLEFAVKGDGRDLAWSKQDYDTWRVDPAGTKKLTVSTTFVADSLDNAMAWSRRDFVLFNGTNVFLVAGSFNPNPDVTAWGFITAVKIRNHVD